ncbi:hypothetical protein CAPN007_16730 [Capnocytophaga canimorsus]|nr:hypothetical protein CAPN007_16730 [Capnocytophaga canimorsus]
MNKTPNTPLPDKRKEILRLLLLMPIIFVLLFTWLGLVILVNKMGLELSADRVFLGVIALMIGVVWAWLSLKGKMPFAQESEPLPYPPTTAQNPVEKLMRGLFVLLGIVVYVVVAMMPEVMVRSFLRIFSFGRTGDTLGMLALLGMLLVFVVVFFISTIKNKFLPQKKSKENSPYASWCVTTMLNWVIFLVIIVLAMFMVNRFIKYS